MPKKAKRETPKEQSERFKREAQKLIDDGKLNPIEGDEGMDGLVKHQKAVK